MNIKWYGHSCFLLTSNDDTRILTDPCAPETGYVLSEIETDAVTVSHQHFDHNYTAAAAGNPIIIDSPGSYNVNEVQIEGFLTSHDKEGGKKRGQNIMFLIKLDDMRILHAGDLGEIPSEETLEALGRVDVLLAPVGGTYTINSDEARKLANLLKPRIVIPMHYKTDASRVDVDGVDRFLSDAKDCRIHRLNQSDAAITPDSLGEDRILVLIAT